MQFIGLKSHGMFSRLDLSRTARTFKIPVFIVQGSEDLVAIPEVSKRWFESITAPQKEIVLVPQTGHEPNQAMIDAQRRIMSMRVRPLAK